ncbi:MAG TPA: S9 family peptidase [Thermomicrobiales bacterium]|nr:S9 family peptidase [Thermomicrobiales bacterium]
MAAETRRPITIEDLCRLRLVGPPQVSPDGARVTYVVTTIHAEGDDNEYRSTIYVAPTDGSAEPRQFTAGPKKDTQPRWSPDGAKLAFVSDRAGKPQVYVLDLAGGEARKVTDAPEGAASPLWSPDGATILYTSKVAEGQGADEKPEGKGGAYKPPLVIDRIKHKMDGEGFFDEKRRHLFLVPAEGGEARQLTSGDWNDNTPAWSPDGAQIAFCANRDDDRDTSDVNDLWVVPVAGGEPRKVTSGRGPVSLPAWSPDGQSLAYIGHERGHMPGANNRLLVVPAAGGAARDLTAGFDRSVGNAVMGDTRMGFDGQRPVWAPDGRSVLFVSTDGGNTAIYRATLDGEIATVIGGERACAAFSTSRDGRTIAFAVSTPTLPGEIVVADGDGGNERQITRHNEALLGELALQPAERIEYTSADGQRIEGWVIKPAGFDPARKYPLVLKIHGGPHGTYGNAFSHEFQLLVAQGYVLLYVNPRGSQGYGQDFAHAIRADWGNLDYQDIMAGVDYVIGQGCVDPERLAAGGASYGGYMTCWLLGHTDRFKAIVTERVVSNLSSFWGTSDIGQTFGAWEMGGKTPREDPETYARCSPITTMDRATTPALIICGERDLRCPIEQSEQVFITLKRNGVPAELVRYPDESHNHAVAGQPKHRVDRLERMLAWLGRYAPANDE